MKLLTALSLLAAAALSGCAIQPDASPSDLPAERAEVFGEAATGDDAAGSNRIYLLAPTDPDAPQRLRSVQRDVVNAPTAVLTSLFAGPNAAERAAQLDTAIPTDVELLAVRPTGQVLTLYLNDVFDDLTAEGLRLAVAQIVSTATDIAGIQAVQLLVDGESRVWPIGDGRLTDRPLTKYDFPGLIESTQPAFPAIPSPLQ